MTQPTSRSTLKDYCKRKLGWPVVEINIDDDQLEDTMDDSIQYWQEYHFDGTTPEYISHILTASTLKLDASPSGTFSGGEYITGGTSGVRATLFDYVSSNTTIRFSNPANKDGRGDGNTYYANTGTLFSTGETITGGTSGSTATVHSSTDPALGEIDNKYISLAENYIGIRGIVPLHSNIGSGDATMFDVEYQFALNELYHVAAGNLKNYVFSQQHLALINQLFTGMPRFRFNRHQDKVYLDIDWGEDIGIDDFFIIEAYSSLDPATNTDAYSDLFLKRYTTALFKKQWGQNLIKFEGLQLPGGVTLNGRQLYDDANTEIEKIEEEMQLRYQLPDDFMIG